MEKRKNEKEGKKNREEGKKKRNEEEREGEGRGWRKPRALIWRLRNVK